MLDEELPEERPELPVLRVQPRIARHHTSAERPASRFLDQVRPDGVGQDVGTGPGKGVPLPFFFPQDAVMRLLLPIFTMASALGSR
jgi:hypothetical protein